MGKRGPAPEPVAAKLARGETRPSRVNYEAPVPRQQEPRMPKGMERDAQLVWLHVCREMRGTGVILDVDRDLLRVYCEAVAAYQRNHTMLLRSGSIIQGSRGRDLVVNPLQRVVREEREAIRLFARELGLSPSARAGLRIDMGAEAGDMETILGPARLRVVGGEDEEE